MLIAALISCSWTAQAQAKPEFAAYGGVDAIQQGRGGTMVTRNGVDYWMTGAPPRPYQIIGVITDRSCLGTSLCGDPLKRPAIAAEARAGHGDGVIVLGKSADTRGMKGGASSYAGTHATEGFGWSSAVAERGVTLLVIRYLPEDAVRP